MKNKFKIIILFLILSLRLLGCGEKYNERSNKNIENMSEVQINEIYKYKNSYVGDNSAAANIIYNLPGNIYSDGFSLKTDKKPYGIIINYKENKNLGSDDYKNFWKDKNISEFLQNNAIVLLSLIENADFIEFNVDNIGEKNYKYERKDLEEKYKEDLKTLLKDEASFKNFFH